MAEKNTGLNQALVFLISSVWVRLLVVTLSSLSKTLIHNYCALRMGWKASDPVFCEMHVKEPSESSDTYCKEEFTPQCTWLVDWLHIAPLQVFKNVCNSSYLAGKTSKGPWVPLPSGGYHTNYCGCDTCILFYCRPIMLIIFYFTFYLFFHPGVVVVGGGDGTCMPHGNNY